MYIRYIESRSSDFDMCRCTAHQSLGGRVSGAYSSLGYNNSKNVDRLKMICYNRPSVGRGGFLGKKKKNSS